MGVVVLSLFVILQLVRTRQWVIERISQSAIAEYKKRVKEAYDIIEIDHADFPTLLTLHKAFNAKQQVKREKFLQILDGYCEVADYGVSPMILWFKQQGGQNTSHICRRYYGLGNMLLDMYIYAQEEESDVSKVPD